MNTHSEKIHPQPAVSEIAVRIRALRKERNWSLSDVEAISQGRIKAVVMGSYERGARALSLKRVIEIAALFDLPVTALFGYSPPTLLQPRATTIIDQRQCLKRAKFAESVGDDTTRYRVLISFLSHISGKRDDWNGEILSLRSTDIETIALMAQLAVSELLAWLEQEQMLLVANN